YARADNYPSRPIRLVIPYAAGGSGDQIGRPWAEKMGSLLAPSMSSQLLQLNQAGRLRILAVTSERRLSGAAELPTVIEAGMPDLRYEGWFGVFAPRAIEDATVERIAQATHKAMADPALQETYRSQGMEPDTGSSADKFGQLVKDELARFAPVIKAIGL